MTIIERLQNIVHQALAQLNITDVETVHIDTTKDISHGDFATNVAMVLAKKLGQNPVDFARTLAEKINELKDDAITQVDVAGPGFINITLSSKYFEQEIQNILNNPLSYGSYQNWSLDTQNKWQNKNILVEHSSPNLFKPFHIGHMMNNTVGESVARLCKLSPAQVAVISYPSDVSLGIGKSVWQLLEYGVETLDNLATLSEKMQFLGRCYAEGTQAMKDNPDREPRIREITQDIYEHRDTEAYRAYIMGRDLNLEYFKSMTDRLGSTFDGYIFESEAGIIGKEIVQNNTPRVYTESDGAIIYEGEQDGLHTRVFINKDGNPTYEAKDTGLLKLKFDRYNPDMSVFITDHEQGPYFKVVITAAGKINPEWQEKTVHKTHGRMTFKGQKMSSRLGNTPLVSDIIDTVVDEVSERTERNLSEQDINMIAVGALKYTILRTQAGKNINFDTETSLSFEGDSGPYLQYTYARCKSILRKAENEGFKMNKQQPADWQVLELERTLIHFPLVTEQAFSELAPHQVVHYVTELAQTFNRWYGQGKILDARDETTGYKLALVSATASVIQQSLWILGFSAPEEM